jgi:hypothetical protein
LLNRPQTEPGGAQRGAAAGVSGETTVTMTERKVIKAKVGLLELAKQLGSVTQACRAMGYSVTASTPSGTSTV